MVNLLDLILSGIAAAIAAMVEETVLAFADVIIAMILGIVPGLA